MFIFSFKALLMICISIFLTACQSGINKDIKEICLNKPALCEDLHPLADCDAIRNTVIQARHVYDLIPDEKNTLLLLKELDAYKACLELTLEIELTRDKARKEKRLDNYLSTKKIADKVLRSSKNISDPHLGYYLWSNHQDLQAKQVFLKAAEQDDLKDIDLLAKLAVYYHNDDPQRALNFYYNALRYSANIEQLPESLLLQLTSLLYRHQQYQHAYLWARVATEISEDNATINLQMIINKGYLSMRQQKQLNQLASDYIESLQEGLLTPPTPDLSIHNDPLIK